MKSLNDGCPRDIDSWLHEGGHSEDHAAGGPERALEEGRWHGAEPAERGMVQIGCKTHTIRRYRGVAGMGRCGSRGDHGGAARRHLQ